MAKSRYERKKLLPSLTKAQEWEEVWTHHLAMIEKYFGRDAALHEVKHD